METKHKVLLKKIVALIGTGILIVNIVLFSFRIIKLELFMGVLVFMALLAYLYYNRNDTK